MGDERTKCRSPVYDQNLWKQAFDILTHHLQRYFQREALQSHRTIREQIIEHVKYIWSMEPEVREKTSVYTFILTRNHISRSAIHKVLQELVNDGKITLNRGKLSFARRYKFMRSPANVRSASDQRSLSASARARIIGFNR